MCDTVVLKVQKHITCTHTDCVQSDKLVICGQILHEDWWDCECDKDYQHNKSVQTRCNKCKAFEEEQPDSRVAELYLHGHISYAETVKYVKT